MASFDLKAVITAEDKASSVVQGAGKNMASSFVNMGKAAAKFGTVLVGAASAAVGFAVKSAADMQMLRTSLDTLTGSAEKGAEIFQKLNKFAASTPFETKDLASAAQTMLSFGISADDAMKNLKMLGDVSMGNSVKLSGLTLAFAQVQSTGRLMGQDLLQMINQGFNPLTIISQQTGKSMAVLKEEMADGAISADMVTKAFEKATSEGGLFYGGMERGSRTFNGVISTLKDNVGMTARAIVGLSDTGDVIKGGLFDKVSIAVQNLIVWLGQNQQKIIDVARTIINDLGQAFTFMWNSVTTTINFFRPMIDIFKEVISNIRLIWTEGLTMNDMWGTVPEKLNPVMNVITMVTTVAKHLWDQFRSLWDVIKAQLLPQLQELWNQLSPILIPAAKALAAVLGLALAGAFVVIIETLKVAVKGLSAFLDFINAVIKAVKDLAKVISDSSIGKFIGSITSGTIGKVKELFGGARALGGPVSGGTPYVVGERGPELFVPSSSGRIVPNNEINNNQVTIQFYGNINNTSNASLDDIGSRLARSLQLARQGI